MWSIAFIYPWQPFFLVALGPEQCPLDGRSLQRRLLSFLLLQLWYYSSHDAPLPSQQASGPRKRIPARAALSMQCT